MVFFFRFWWFWASQIYRRRSHASNFCYGKLHHSMNSTMHNYKNVIYILTNPLYAGYVKIGYASDLMDRIGSLNTGMLRNFEAYAVYETPMKNADREYHAIIDDLTPIVRARVINGEKVQDKEFYKLEPEQAYDILKHIAALSGTLSRLHRMDGSDALSPTPPNAQAPIADGATDNVQVLAGRGAGRPKAYTIAGKNYSFSTWRDSYIEHCNVIVHAVGFATFKATVNGLKVGPKSKAPMFSDNEGVSSGITQKSAMSTSG